MKNTWVLRVVVLCGFMLLGARFSSNPSFKSVSQSYLHQTADHTDIILAIELEDEVEDALTFFISATSFDWKVESFVLLGLFLALFFTRKSLVHLPAYLRFHNLRL